MYSTYYCFTNRNQSEQIEKIDNDDGLYFLLATTMIAPVCLFVILQITIIMDAVAGDAAVEVAAEEEGAEAEANKKN